MDSETSFRLIVFVIILIPVAVSLNIFPVCPWFCRCETIILQRISSTSFNSKGKAGTLKRSIFPAVLTFISAMAFTRLLSVREMTKASIEWCLWSFLFFELLPESLFKR